MKTTRISVRLDRGLRATIRKRAKAAGRREGEIIREALQREFQEQPPQKSSYDVAAALGIVGCIEKAPQDLSSNPMHMEGFGK